MKFVRLQALSLFICLVFVSPGETQDPSSRGEGREQSAQFRVDVNLVTIRFSAKDRGGRFVNDLSEDDFTVYEGDARQKVAFFRRPSRDMEARPVILSFLIDVSGSTVATRTEEVAAAENFLKNVAGGTEIGVFGFADTLYRFQDFSTDAGRVRKGFERARKAMGRTSLYASLAELLELLGRRPAEKRRVVVIISDGEDPDISRAESVMGLAARLNVTIYTIWVPSAGAVFASAMEPSARASADEQRAVFASLAERSGGRSFESRESIVDGEGTLAEINAELFGSLYTLGYYTADPTADRRSRRIRVATHGDFQVQGIFANLPERLRTKKQFVSALFNNSELTALPPDLSGRFQEIGAELNVLPMKPDAGLQGLPFRIQVSPFSLAGFAERSVRTHLGIIGVLLDVNGEEVSRVRDFLEVNLSKGDIARGRSIVYNSKVVAPPGQYDLRLAVLDLTNWRMTAFEDRVFVQSK
ncbi:MAG: VWA domain-containing protein [Acidobacteria bacterium]|nr:VWA domain-containing protein [Acidobacteriota bacterium]